MQWNSTRGRAPYEPVLSGVWNRRKDEYGGDIKGRIRFVLEIIDSIKTAARRRLPVTIRHSLRTTLKAGVILRNPSRWPGILKKRA